MVSGQYLGLHNPENAHIFVQIHKSKSTFSFNYQKDALSNMLMFMLIIKRML